MGERWGYQIKWCKIVLILYHFIFVKKKFCKKEILKRRNFSEKIEYIIKDS